MALAALTVLSAQRPLALGALDIVRHTNGHNNRLVAAQTHRSTVHFGPNDQRLLPQNYFPRKDVSGGPEVSAQSSVLT